MEKNTAGKAKQWSKELESQRKIKRVQKQQIQPVNHYEFISADKTRIESENKNEKIIIYAGIMVILIIITGFLSAGIYNYFFYEKIKNDVREIEIFQKANKIKINQQSNASYQWKRTIWEEYKGKICSTDNKCTYSYIKKWKDCNLGSNQCTTHENSFKRNSHYLLKPKTEYYNR